MSGLRIVRGADLSDATAQSEGMRRGEALGAATTGSSGLWMGITEMLPGATSAPHHHGHSETGIYVVSGQPVFRSREGGKVVEQRAQPGDFVFVPPDLPHVEANPGEEVACVVIARTTSEAIVVNLDRL